MRKLKSFLIDLVDPYRQSFLFFKWHPLAVISVLLGAVLLTVFWRGGLARLLLRNSFAYLPNFLMHEMAGHNLVGQFFLMVFPNGLGEWLITIAGNGVESLVPLLACLFVLRLEGGRWLVAPFMYWFSTTLYDAGKYAQDARACSLPLASSDMVTSYKPGEICGDWHHILEPIGLLNYDQVIAYTFLFMGSLIFMLAIYSAFYYWTHPNFYAEPETLKPTEIPAEQLQDEWRPPNIYDPRSFQKTGDRVPSSREYPTNGRENDRAGYVDRSADDRRADYRRREGPDFLHTDKGGH